MGGFGVSETWNFGGAMTMLTGSKVVSRAELNQLLNSADLKSATVRAEISTLVIDEVLDQKWAIQRIEGNGGAPLNVRCTKFLRPVPQCVYNSEGWSVHIRQEWFAD